MASAPRSPTRPCSPLPSTSWRSRASPWPSAASAPAPSRSGACRAWRRARCCLPTSPRRWGPMAGRLRRCSSPSSRAGGSCAICRRPGRFASTSSSRWPGSTSAPRGSAACAETTRAPAPAMGVLDEIVAHKREEVAVRRAARPQAALEAVCRGLGPARELAEALTPGAGRRVRLIAEVKKASPSKGVLAADLDVTAQARTYAAAGADAVSVLTDARWFKGSLEDLVAVRGVMGRPLLRKDFTIDEYQLWEARAAGADAALLIVAALDRRALRDLHQAAKGLGVQTLVEAHTTAELEEALAIGARVVGVNNRNLQTLTTDLGTSLHLLPLIPPGHVAVAESGIFTRDDVERVAAAGAHAVLVGEALVRAADVAAKVRELCLEEA